MRRGLAAGAAYGALLALVVTGCGHSGAPVHDVLLRPAAKPAGAPTPLTAVQAPLALTAAEEVARVGLRSIEIPSAQRVRWPADGHDGSATVPARCPASLPSDRLRLARRTVTGTVPHSGVVFTDQAMAYDSAATARAALHQVRRAVAGCADGPVRAWSARLPVRPSYALAVTVPGVRGLRHVLVVGQQRGDVVDLLTLVSPRPVTRAQQRLLAREARGTGTRLARLPLASDGT